MYKKQDVQDITVIIKNLLIILSLYYSIRSLRFIFIIMNICCNNVPC